MRPLSFATCARSNTSMKRAFASAPVTITEWLSTRSTSVEAVGS